MQIYRELAAHWYGLLDPVEDHEEEAACYEAALVRGRLLRRGRCSSWAPGPGTTRSS